MHYQVIISQEDVNLTKIEAKGEYTYQLTLEKFDERITYKLFDKTVTVIRETVENERFSYSEHQKYTPEVIPFLVGLVCAVTGVRQVQLGESYHTVNVYLLNEVNRFIPQYNGRDIQLHEKVGKVFTKEGDCYVSVDEMVIADSCLKNMGHSLKFFDKKFLVRFMVKGRFIYFPASDVWSDPDVREMRYRHIPEVRSLDWKGLAASIESTVKSAAAPILKIKQI